MKRLILVFCMDGDAGKAMAKTLRNTDTTAQLRDAATFDGVIEHCDGVVIMPDVARWPRDRIEATYAGFVMSQPQEKAMPVYVQGSALFGSNLVDGPFIDEVAGTVTFVAQTKRKPGRPRKNAA